MLHTGPGEIALPAMVEIELLPPSHETEFFWSHQAEVNSERLLDTDELTSGHIDECPIDLELGSPSLARDETGLRIVGGDSMMRTGKYMWLIISRTALI